MIEELVESINEWCMLPLTYKHPGVWLPLPDWFTSLVQETSATTISEMEYL